MGIGRLADHLPFFFIFSIVVFHMERLGKRNSSPEDMWDEMLRLTQTDAQTGAQTDAQRCSSLEANSWPCGPALVF